MGEIPHTPAAYQVVMRWERLTFAELVLELALINQTSER